MEFGFTRDQYEFRDQFVSWLDKNLPKGWNPLVYRSYESCEEWAEIYRNFQKRLFEAGYAGLHLPREFGGQGKTLIEEFIVLETIASTCVECKIPGNVAHNMVTPVLLKHGTEEQKRMLLPKILGGTHIWCEGFSEPNAGSDIANLATRAVRDGGYYIVNGQKAWTTFAQIADYCILLVRTESEKPKHKGLSYLLMDMKLPGIVVRPIKQITGVAEFSEMYLEDVRIPEDMLVGKEGEGWKIAIRTLMFERTLSDANKGGAYLKNIRSIIQMAKQTKRSGKAIIRDPILRQHLAQAFVEAMVVKQHGYRRLSQLLNGEFPGPEGSLGKILWSELNQNICETAMMMQGPYSQILKGSPWSISNGMWQYLYLRSKANTIEAGTTEIQRNILGERVLGFPKDARGFSS